MRIFWCSLIILSAALSFAQEPEEEVAPVATLAESIRPDWAGPIWDDGNAEVAAYEGERILYGEARPHELQLITVAEDFNREFMAKAEWPYGQKPVLPVLKQNQVATIPTPNYPYHYMSSLFFDRSNAGHLVKMSIGSQEWCGTTFKQYEMWRETPIFWYSSYWDGEGTGNLKMANHSANTFFEEELPLLVRALDFRDGLQAGLMLQPIQTTNRAEKPEPVPAALEVDHPEADIVVPAGTFAAEHVWRVTLNARDGRRVVFYVAEDNPQTLLAFKFDDGRHYVLKQTARRQYWRIGN